MSVQCLAAKCEFVMTNPQVEQWHFDEGSTNKLDLAYCDDNKHALGHVEGMSPVMICHSSIVLPHSQKPTAQNLRKDTRIGDKQYVHTHSHTHSLDSSSRDTFDRTSPHSQF